MDAKTIALEIHRRRVTANGEAEKCQAMAEAIIYLAYEITPTLSDFDQEMCWRLPDEDDKLVTVVGTERTTIRVSPDFVDRFDIIIFARGRDYRDNEILGWLPSNRVRQAPEVKTSMDDFMYEISEEFMFTLPMEFKFEEPDLNVPRIWSYEHGGWYLPTTKTYLYSRKGGELIAASDQKLAGRSDKGRKR